MLAQMPTPTSGRSFNGSAILDDGPQDQETLKIDHRWGDKWTTTGMYGHQQTGEPGSAFWGPHGTIPADPSGTIAIPHDPLLLDQPDHRAEQHDGGRRALRLQLLPRTTAPTTPAASTPPRWAIPPSFTSVLTDGRVPGDHDERLQQHRPRRPQHHAASSARPPTPRCRSSWATTRSSSASTTGGCRAYAEAPNNGNFGVHAGVHAGAEPQHREQRRRRRVRQLPARLSRHRRRERGDARHLLHRLLLGVRRRTTTGITSKLTLNFGLRYEYEPGIAAEGQPVHGRLRSRRAVPGAGARDGAPGRADVCRRRRLSRRARQQPLNNVAPRGGFAYSMTEKTVIRGGYGLYWVPPITDIAEATIGARGYSASTTFLSSTDGGLTPGRHDVESVPGRHHAAAGQLARPGHRRAAA